MDNNNNYGKVIGEFLSVVLGAIVLLGLASAIVYVGWNYALTDTTSVSAIKYYQCFLLVMMMRSLTMIKLSK